MRTSLLLLLGGLVACGGEISGGEGSTKGHPGDGNGPKGTDTGTEVDTDGGTAQRDDDGDGLTNGDEAALGTDPEAADSDADGWDDGVEVTGNTDPSDDRDHPYTGGWPIGACRDDLVAQGTQPGQVVPDFALKDQNGETVHLHDFCDRPVFLVFAAFW